MKVEFEPSFRQHAEAAVGRLGYIFADCAFKVSDGQIEVSGPTEGREQELRREVLYQLYRERIYQEALPLRTMMYRALLT